MKIDENNLKKARSLLSELKELEEVRDVMQNYDAKVFATFWTGHNNNTKVSKTVQIAMPPDMIKLMDEHVSNRIYEIKKELEAL